MGKHDQIADLLTQDILRGQYRPGERLPSERDLATRFDANRGAVREAMKKLEHLGIACVQPGGARVVPLNQASLDVIEPMLSMGDVPNRELVDNIMQVIQGLVHVALEATINEASDEQIADIRKLVQPLCEENLDQEAHGIASFALMQGIMTSNSNLVSQLIARGLMLRLGPKILPLHEYSSIDTAAHRVCAQQLDTALARRDMPGIRGVFAEFFKLNREALKRAYAAYEAAQLSKTQEVAAR